jgi:hypothetical protein
VFNHWTLVGSGGAILWGYRTAAAVRTWRIVKTETHWQLVAQLERVDAFGCRQKPLLFSAPRAGGFWCWPVESIDVVALQLVARLGPPEQ